jgi:hypothetical protein
MTIRGAEYRLNATAIRPARSRLLVSRLRWRPPAAVKLAAAIWSLSLVAQTLNIVLMRHALPPWAPAYLLGATLIGATLSTLVPLAAYGMRDMARMARWRVLALLVLALATGMAIIDQGLLALVKPPPPHTAPLTLDGVTFNLLYYTWLFALYAAALEVISTTRQLLEAQRRAAEARELAQEARLRALRFQLNPHFLFNTLNAISSLIVNRRNARAEAMLLKLCAFLRSTLDLGEASVTPLASELGLIEAYLEIEAARFPALRVEIDSSEALQTALVPSLLLQPLVENAVRHAIAPAGGQGRISISARVRDDRLVLAVRDSGSSDAAPGEPGSGIGLANTRQRLVALYGTDAELRLHPAADGFTAEVRLPLGTGP